MALIRIFQIAKELNISHTDILSFLDTKGVGVIDPGAFSTSIILKEFFREIFNEKNN